jgi:membrane-associated protein
MEKLDEFFARYGGLTIVITRFMPFFRTFAPFIAGTGHMNFGRFTLFNCIGGISWVSLFVLVGYFFGGIPFVQEHFEVIVLGIVGVSVLPALIGAIRTAVKSHQGTAQEQALREYRTEQIREERARKTGEFAPVAEFAADAVEASKASRTPVEKASSVRGKHAKHAK